METSTAPKPIPMTAEVPKWVNKAIRDESLKRQLAGEDVTMKDIHREWLVEMATKLGFGG
ncbi:hypothetical protein [Hymenobacter fodinae]|uniref:Uncharacterized protein n=1 Tax=Hymenobacter fodinae TaxID=2510796 RepID=A0A4Z0P5T0_9BACT|nr:hypothetical protein [Hymenobacter fodinae]TGE07744.1 hypothetical protein EU556_08295 [Hymenobacter fodinae]